MRSCGINGDGWPIDSHILLKFFLVFLIILVKILDSAVELLLALFGINIQRHHVSRKILYRYLKFLQLTLNSAYLFTGAVEPELGSVELHHGTVKLTQCQVHFPGMYIAENDERDNQGTHASQNYFCTTGHVTMII